MITSPRGAAPEIVDHGVTGFLCSQAEDAAAAIASVASLDRRPCRAAVTDRFSARRIVADHIALYRDVLDGHDELAA